MYITGVRKDLLTEVAEKLIPICKVDIIPEEKTGDLTIWFDNVKRDEISIICNYRGWVTIMKTLETGDEPVMRLNNEDYYQVCW